MKAYLRRLLRPIYVWQLALNSLSMIAISLLPIQVYAIGFELPVAWSGRYGGMGNAASSHVKGPEALYFNPAGLAEMGKLDATLDGSHTFTKVKGPVTQEYEQVSSGYVYVPMGGLFVGHGFNERFGIGAGAYAAAGSGGDFGDVDFGLANRAKARVSGKTSDLEIGVGAGYRVTDELSLGAAWRISLLSSEGYGASAVTQIASSVTDLSGQNYAGFRLGAQYAPASKNWGLGLSFRNSVDWNMAGGNYKIKSMASGLELASSTDATFEAMLPWQIQLGGHYLFFEKLLVALQYEYTNYVSVKEISYKATALSRIGLADGRLSIPIAFRNSHIARLGLEYNGLETFSFRAGYVIVSPVTAKNRPSYGFAPPAFNHTFTLGAGHSFLEHFIADLALDYTFSKGTGNQNGITNLGGDQLNDRFAIHTGLTYRM